MLINIFNINTTFFHVFVSYFYSNNWHYFKQIHAYVISIKFYFVTFFFRKNRIKAIIGSVHRNGLDIIRIRGFFTLQFFFYVFPIYSYLFLDFKLCSYFISCFSEIERALVLNSGIIFLKNNLYGPVYFCDSCFYLVNILFYFFFFIFISAKKCNHRRQFPNTPNK